MRLVLLFLISSIVLAGCSNETPQAQTLKDWEKIPLKYSKNFQLFKKGDSFMLKIIDPDTKKPVRSIEINPGESERVICLTATVTGMFCELNKREHIIGVTAENQLYDSTLKKLFSKGRIQEFGDFTQLSLERIVKASPDLILYNYVNNEFPHQKKLERLGVKVIVVNDWLEAHPLAKAEWIKVVGAMTGKYDEASGRFNEIEKRYLSFAKSVDSISEKPTIISGNLIGDQWYTPSGENYFGILIADAGGDYVYKESTGPKSLSLTLEQILEDNQETEIWLNPGVPTKKQLLQLNPHSRLLKASENSVYCYSGSNNKFWEQSASRPDLMLEDLIHVFHPELDPHYNFHYYAPLIDESK